MHEIRHGIAAAEEERIDARYALDRTASVARAGLERWDSTVHRLAAAMDELAEARREVDEALRGQPDRARSTS